MHDDKRQLRKLKREVKRTGVKKRRRFLKDVSANPEDFDFGGNESQALNQPRRKKRVQGEDGWGRAQ